NLQGSAEYLAEVLADHLAEIVLDRLRIGAERSEHHAIPDGHTQFGQAVGTHIKLRRHPALAVGAAPKRNAKEIAGLAIAPSVIDAGEVWGVSVGLAHNFSAAMRTAIHERADCARLHPIHDDRYLAHVGGDKITAIGDFSIETEQRPSWSAEYALVLLLV